MSNLDITHFGYNRTDIGAHDKPSCWYPVVQYPEQTLMLGPMHIQWDYARNGKRYIHKAWPLKEWLKHLIANQMRLCRIWVQYRDGSTRCVYWYEQDQLTF